MFKKAPTLQLGSHFRDSPTAGCCNRLTSKSHKMHSKILLFVFNDTNPPVSLPVPVGLSLHAENIIFTSTRSHLQHCHSKGLRITQREKINLRFSLTLLPGTKEGILWPCTNTSYRLITEAFNYRQTEIHLDEVLSDYHCNLA